MELVNTLHPTPLIEEFTSTFASKNTIKSYKCDLKIFTDFLQQKGSKDQWLNFNQQSSLEYLEFLEKRTSSLNSKRRKIQSIRSFFDFLIKKNIIHFNPLKELPSFKKVLYLPQPPVYSDICNFFTLIHQSNSLYKERNLLLFLFIYELGLQLKDFKDLTIQNLSKDYLTFFNKQYTRSIPIPSYLNVLIKKIVKQDFSYIFYTGNPYILYNEALTPRSIEVIFKQYSDTFNIKITPKSLRQACITKWIYEKKSPTTICSYLGLKDKNIIQNYPINSYYPLDKISL